MTFSALCWTLYVLLRMRCMLIMHPGCCCRPQSQHVVTAQLVEMSKKMVRDAPSTSFPPSNEFTRKTNAMATPAPM